MSNLTKKLTLVFGAGCLGGLLNSLVVWLFVSAGVTNQLDVSIGVTRMPAWLYPRIVWGGIWGALFLLPILKNRRVFQGLLYSLGPTLVQLLFLFPQTGRGMLGLKLGNLTPLFVLFFNAVWGITAALWLRALGDGGGDKKK
jgi:hypothetical protein